MEIEKSELIKRFSLLERAIPGRPTIPCTEGILVKDGRMCTNDLQNAISILAPEAAPESFILPKKAIAMVKNLPDGMVQITPKGDDSLIIKAGNIRTSIKTMSIDGFPENFTLSEATEATIDFDDLVEMLSSVVYATASSEARPIHTGVLLDGDGTDLNVVACDGFRCAWAHTEYPETFKMVIPKPTVKLLLSIKQAGKLKISMQSEKAVFEIGDCKIYARLLSGSFLDYRRVFPSRTKSIGVDRGKLLGAMNRIMICSDDTHKGKVELDGTDTSLQVKCTNSSADYIEELEVQDKFPADLRIMFNSAYVVDALKSYDCSVIDCFFGDKSTEPLVMDDGVLKSLILPVRFAEGTKGAEKA